MTTKALVRTSPLDFELARQALRDRAGTTVTIAATTVSVIVEPLLRRTESGSLEQTIRVDAPVELTQAQVLDQHGTSLLRDIERTASGIRLFIPEVTAPTDVSLFLPELSAEASATVTVTPVRHWEIHLVHHSHLDIGYTDPQGRVLAEHLSYLDSVLRLVKETDQWPSDAQFRWTVESLWSFDQWAENRPEAVVREFVEQVRRGRIELTALPFNLNTEACSTDELHELLRIASRAKKRHDVPIRAAMQTDVPGCVGALADVLVANGVRYLSVAHNWAGRSVPHLTGGQDLPRLFWWRAGGGRVLVWVTDTPHGLAYMEGSTLGFDASYDSVEDLLPAYLTALATHPYPFDGKMFGFASADTPLHRVPYEWDILHLRVLGRFADNAPPRRIMSETVRRWNERWAYPHLRLSTNDDFFTAAEERLGDQIPEFSGDWNNWWADGMGSGARPVQLARRAQTTLADAQTLSSFAGLLGADGAADDTREAQDVYLDLALFDEHTWGAAYPWTHGDDHHHSGDEQWHWKYHTATASHDGANGLKSRALARLGRRLGTARGALASVYAANTTAVARHGVVRMFVPESRIPLETALSAIDGRTGKPLATTESPQLNPDHREAGRFLHIAIPDAPPAGLVRIDLMPAPDSEPRPPATTSMSGEPLLENEHLRVEVDLRTASIRSIFAKKLSTDLVNPDATFGFNAYIHDEYGTAGGLHHMSGFIEAAPNLSLLGPRSLARPAALTEVGRDAVRAWLTYESSCDGTRRIITTLSLEHGSDRLDIVNRMDKSPTMAKESGYFAFPFHTAPDAVLRYDTTGSVAGTDIPEVPGGAQHMRVIRHWIALHSGDTTVSWTTQDAPLVQLGDIALPYAPFPPTTPKDEPGTVYSWVHNNIWDTNFPGMQGFEMSFRYTVSAARASSPEQACAIAAIQALPHSQPLTGVFADGDADRPCPGELGLITLSDNRVRLVGLTTPEQGSLLVRLQSVSDGPIECRLRFTLPIVAAHDATYLGEPLGPAHRDGEDIVITIGARSSAACLLRLNLADPS